MLFTSPSQPTLANEGARFGFAGAGVGFDQRPFAPATYPTRREIFTGLSTGDLLIIAFAGPQRHELRAVGDRRGNGQHCRRASSHA